MRLKIKHKRRSGRVEWGSCPRERGMAPVDAGAVAASDWPRLWAAVSAALEPHPEALRAVQEALARWDAA